METNFLVYIVSHITITGYKTKTTTALHAFKIHHKLFVVSGLNNACSYPEPALTHLSKGLTPVAAKCLPHFVSAIYHDQCEFSDFELVVMCNQEVNPSIITCRVL